MTIHFHPKEKQLLQLMSLKPMSLSELACSLSLSETQINTHLQHFKSLGLQYQCIENEYYSFPHIWDEIDFNEVLATIYQHSLQLHHFDVIHSTNTYLKQPHMAPMTCCFSEMQTQGRGRFGRPWCSPYGQNIYLSTRLSLPIPSAKCQGLSSVMALALSEAILQLYPTLHLQIKWPNDLLYQEKKLAGILIEIVEIKTDACQLIIGMGLNVNAEPIHMLDVSQPWTSLYQILGQPVKRGPLLSLMIQQVLKFCQQFVNDGFSSFISAWNEKDALNGKMIKLQDYQGIARGIDENGRLILEDEHHQLHFLDSGEVSLNGDKKLAPHIQAGCKAHEKNQFQTCSSGSSFSFWMRK